MSARVQVVRVDSAQYEDEDDCLSAAAVDVARAHGVEGWQCTARWADDELRDGIVVEVQS